MNMDEEKNNHEVDLEPGREPNRQLVEGLAALLEDAKAGRLEAAGVIGVRGPGNFAPMLIGNRPMEMCCGAVCLLMMIAQPWVSQIMQQVAQAQGKGLQRATAADLDRLPQGFGRRG
jgi:hypothetical protein